MSPPSVQEPAFPTGGQQFDELNLPELGDLGEARFEEVCKARSESHQCRRIIKE